MKFFEFDILIKFKFKNINNLNYFSKNFVNLLIL